MAEYSAPFSCDNTLRIGRTGYICNLRRVRLARTTEDYERRPGERTRIERSLELISLFSFLSHNMISLCVSIQYSDITLLCGSCYTEGSRDGTVVRAFAPHQFGPGSILGLCVICGLSLLLVLVLVPRGFSPGTPVFPSPQKPTFPNSNSIWNRRATGLSIVTDSVLYSVTLVKQS